MALPTAPYLIAYRSHSFSRCVSAVIELGGAYYRLAGYSGGRSSTDTTLSGLLL